MVAVRPVREAEKAIGLCDKYGIQPGFDCLYYAEEGESPVGWMTLRQEKNRVVITHLEVLGCADYSAMNPNQSFLAELMVRSALAYAQNRMIEWIACEDSRLFRFLEIGLHFAVTGDIAEIACADMTHICGDCH